MLKGLSFAHHRKCHFPLLKALCKAHRSTLILKAIFITVVTLPASQLLGYALRMEVILGQQLESLTLEQS